MPIQKTKRAGVPHLDKEVMGIKTTDFLDIINFIEKNDSSITPEIASVTEKADGFGLRFGLDEKGKFFIESSHSGPVFDVGAFAAYTKKKFGTANEISKGYDDILERLSKFKKLLDILRKYNTPTGIKIICEAFYLPNGKSKTPVSQDVKFVAIQYKRDLLGNWASFILIDVQDGEGHQHPKSKKIISEIKAISDKNIIFDDTIVKVFKKVTLKNEIKQIKKAVDVIEKKHKQKIKDVLLDKSRKRPAVQKRKEIKAEILKFQKKVANKIRGSFVTGKWGSEMEGIVINLSNGRMFKVITDLFTKSKELARKDRLKESSSLAEYLYMLEEF